MAVSATVVTRNKQQFQGAFSDMWVVSATVDPASVAAEGSGTDTITVAGVALGDIVVGWSLGVTTNSNLVVQCWVSAADTVSVMYSNNNVAAGAAIDVASSTFKCLVGRPSWS